MERNIFKDSQKTREEILSVSPYTEANLPMSVAYFWPTKYCPIGCEHCMFASPGLVNIDRKMVLSETAVDNFIEISKEIKS